MTPLFSQRHLPVSVTLLNRQCPSRLFQLLLSFTLLICCTSASEIHNFNMPQLALIELPGRSFPVTFSQLISANIRRFPSGIRNLAMGDRQPEETRSFLSKVLPNRKTSILIPLPPVSSDGTAVVFLDDKGESLVTQQARRTHIFRPYRSSPSVQWFPPRGLITDLRQNNVVNGVNNVNNLVRLAPPLLPESEEEPLSKPNALRIIPPPVSLFENNSYANNQDSLPDAKEEESTPTTISPIYSETILPNKIDEASAQTETANIGLKETPELAAVRVDRNAFLLFLTSTEAPTTESTTPFADSSTDTAATEQAIARRRSNLKPPPSTSTTTSVPVERTSNNRRNSQTANTDNRSNSGDLRNLFDSIFTRSNPVNISYTKKSFEITSTTEVYGFNESSTAGGSAGIQTFLNSVSDSRAKDSFTRKPSSGPRPILRAVTVEKMINKDSRFTTTATRELTSTEKPTNAVETSNLKDNDVYRRVRVPSLSVTNPINLVASNRTRASFRTRLEGRLPNVRGRPGVDYPLYGIIPKTNFVCRDMELPGFYADMETGCQVYHSCHHKRGSVHSFLCPNGTIFSQEHLICDWWYNVKCDRSPNHYKLNKEAFSAETKKFIPKRA